MSMPRHGLESSLANLFYLFSLKFPVRSKKLPAYLGRHSGYLTKNTREFKNSLQCRAARIPGFYLASGDLKTRETRRGIYSLESLLESVGHGRRPNHRVSQTVLSHLLVQLWSIEGQILIKYQITIIQLRFCYFYYSDRGSGVLRRGSKIIVHYY